MAMRHNPATTAELENEGSRVSAACEARIVDTWQRRTGEDPEDPRRIHSGYCHVSGDKGSESWSRERGEAEDRHSDSATSRWPDVHDDSSGAECASIVRKCPVSHFAWHS